MFFPEESLKRGGKFYLCWVADSWPLRFARITTKQLWSSDVRIICEDLLEVITNESGRPTNRFSLRLSSQLIRGLVRLYQKKATILLGQKVAEIAAAREQVMPANLLWMEFILADKPKEAEAIWNKCLKDAQVLVFRRILQEAHVRKRPDYIQQLIKALKSNPKISEGSLGNAYSRLINLYLMDANTDDAIATYEQSKKDGIVSFNKNTLKRLQMAAEAEGKKVDIIFTEDS